MILLIGIGGITGALCRYAISRYLNDRSQNSIPAGTWLVNVSGSFLLGILYRLYADDQLPKHLWLLFGTGFLGAYTTFSTFGFESMQMLLKQQYVLVARYIIYTLLLSLAGAWIGMAMV
jgi:CrcB protein